MQASRANVNNGADLYVFSNWHIAVVSVGPQRRDMQFIYLLSINNVLGRFRRRMCLEMWQRMGQQTNGRRRCIA